MKALIILAFTLVSLNVSASENKIGQDLKGDCKFGPQSSRKAEPKNADQPASQPVQQEKKNKSV